MRITRVFHHFSKCEEFSSAMWSSSLCVDKKNMVSKCSEFMRDIDMFDNCMGAVISSWPNSCESNFTNASINQVAWLGQAAAALGCGAGEEITKSAWGLLSEDQMAVANAAAKRHIKKWKELYLENKYA